jgi:hypothetical protein
MSVNAIRTMPVYSARYKPVSVSKDSPLATAAFLRLAALPETDNITIGLLAWRLGSK